MRHSRNSATQEHKVSEIHIIWFGSERSKSRILILISMLMFLDVVAIAGYFINYATETRKNTSSATGAIYLAVAQGCFAIGRFSGSFLMQFVKPR